MSVPSELLNQVDRLCETDRRELLAHLKRGLNETNEPPAPIHNEPAFIQEIERRSDQAQVDRQTLRDAFQFLDELQNRLEAKPFP
jgi:hypothetical protein